MMVVLTAAVGAVTGTLRHEYVLLGFAMAIAALSAGFRGDRRFRQQVDALIGLAERLGRGDMAARETIPGAPAAGLERLAESLGAMASALQKREQEIRSRHDLLASQSRRDRLLLEHGSHGLALYDAELRILYATPAVTRLLGYPPDRLIGLNALAVVHADDRERARALLRDVVAAPNGSATAVLRVSTFDGASRWFDAEFSNLLGAPDVGAIVCRYRDVTQARGDRLQTEHTLQMLSRAIEQSADSVFITGANGVIEYVNPAFEALTGYAKEEAVGQTPRLLKSGRTPPAVYESLWRALSEGKVFRTVIPNKTKDGRLYDEDQTITPIRDESRAITHFVSTGRDVTQRERMQEAVVRLNRELELQASRFAGILHDEAGQFLTAAHLALADVSRGAAPELAGRLKEVRWALDQIEDRLRSLSREIHPEVVEDLGLVEAVSFSTRAFARRTSFRVELNTTIGRRYPIALEVVLYRLIQEALTNIHRHAAADCVWVSLTEERGVVCCSVRDNGSGFDVAPVLARRAGHLGLRLMQDRLETVGGTLEIVSIPGHGTELRACVPLHA